MKKTVAVLLFGFLVCSICLAEKIYLKNGDIITGKIIETKEDLVVVETDKGKLEIEKINIEKMEYTDQTSTVTLRDKNSAFVWRPLPTFIAALQGYFVFMLEGQAAFTKEFAITSIVEFGSVNGMLIYSMQLGPQYRPNGNYLKGFVLGLYPGIGYVMDFLDWIWFFSFTFETGYQWVFNSGLLIGLTTGGSYVGSNPYYNAFKFNISVHFGIAFKNPIFKAK